MVVDMNFENDLKHLKKQIGIGLVGTGFMAKAHTNAYSTIKYIYADMGFMPRLKMIASSSNERAFEAARRYGFEQGVEGYERLINDPEIDVVDVCNADRLHRETAIAAMAKNKHVICEKPLATSLADALAMAACARSHPVKTLCGFNYRFIPAIMLARRLIESGVMGRVYSFNGSYLQNVGAYDDTPFENLWYAAGPKSSGVLYGIGSHIIDMARFLVGDIETVMGGQRNYTPLRNSINGGQQSVSSEEDAIAVVSFKNGALGSIRASAIAAGRLNRLSWEISCSKGTLIFDMDELNYLWVCCKDSPIKEVSGFTKVNVTQVDKDHPFMDVWWPRGHGLGWEHAHINEIAYFLDCISHDKPVAPYGATFEDGCEAIRIIEALKLSDESGKRVLVSEVGVKLP